MTIAIYFIMNTYTVRTLEKANFNEIKFCFSENGA